MREGGWRVAFVCQYVFFDLCVCMAVGVIGERKGKKKEVSSSTSL